MYRQGLTISPNAGLPTSGYIFLYFLSRDSQGRLRSRKPQSRASPCKLIGNLITSYSGMPGDPKKSHHMPSRDVIQHLLALLDQRRHCSDGLKSFQSRLTIRTDTHVFLWYVLKLCFVNTGKDSKYLGLENCSISS